MFLGACTFHCVVGKREGGRERERHTHCGCQHSVTFQEGLLLGVEDTDRLGKWTSNYSPHFLTLAYTCTQTNTHTQKGQMRKQMFLIASPWFSTGLLASRSAGRINPTGRMCQFASSFIVPIGIWIFHFILFSVHFFATTRDLTQTAPGLLFSPNAYDLEKKIVPLAKLE